MPPYSRAAFPIGLIVADKVAGTSTDFVVEKHKGGVLQLKARIFPEHLEHGPNEQAQEFMMKMMEGVRETLEK
jgi:hypothetical protein